MNDLPSVSLVVASRDRPESLRRLLVSLRQQSLARFDLVIVSNAAVAQMPGLEFRQAAFSEANISAARNAGIRAAKGEIIAFCDDDCVPEPNWLERLIAPFADPKLGAAGGDALGRNGVSLQWGAIEIDAAANELESGKAAGIFAPEPGRALITIGTNCAFRRAALRAIGGFDEAFHYFLDEADANWRLARAGWHMARVPGAIVHHGFIGNSSRHANRAPKDLTEIAASTAVFLRKHMQVDPAGSLAAFRAGQMARVRAAFDLGKIGKQEYDHLVQTLAAGLAAGAARPFGAAVELGAAGAPMTPPVLRKPGNIALCGSPLRLRRMRKAAVDLTKAGHVATVICFGLNALALNVRYERSGYWLHFGGVYGRGDRSGRIFRLRWRRQAYAEEVLRVASQREFGIVAICDRRHWQRDPTGIPELDGFRVLRFGAMHASGTGSGAANFVQSS